MERLLVSSSPHLRSSDTVRNIMLDVLLALAPATIVGCFFFGFRAFANIAAAIISAVLFEFLYQKLNKKKVTVKDLSACVTGLLLAMNIPAAAPIWLSVVGSFFAIVIVKQLFGGLGQNFLNPALAARAFLLASYPVQMTDWSSWPMKYDTITSATPLAAIKGGYGTVNGDSIFQAAFGLTGGTIGETCAIALLIGGLYLLARRVINWRIPVFYLGTAALVTWVLGRPDTGFFGGMPQYELLLGGLMLGAFFMATDYATSPVTPKGQIIMGVGCGILTVIIRRFSNAYPEGVSYSILLMNVAVPLIDKFTRPKVFGEAKIHGHS